MHDAIIANCSRELGSIGIVLPGGSGTWRLPRTHFITIGHWKYLWLPPTVMFEKDEKISSRSNTNTSEEGRVQLEGWNYLDDSENYSYGLVTTKWGRKWRRLVMRELQTICEIKTRKWLQNRMKYAQCFVSEWVLKTLGCVLSETTRGGFFLQEKYWIGTMLNEYLFWRWLMKFSGFLISQWFIHFLSFCWLPKISSDNFRDIFHPFQNGWSSLSCLRYWRW